MTEGRKEERGGGRGGRERGAGEVEKYRVIQIGFFVASLQNS